VAGVERGSYGRRGERQRPCCADDGPLSARRLFGVRAAYVFGSEALWVWLPAALGSAAMLLARRTRPPKS
jgi:hypothetical protein